MLTLKRPCGLRSREIVRVTNGKVSVNERGDREAWGGGRLSDPDAVALIRKQVKQRHDSIERFEKGGRPELAAKELKEIAFLTEYLPKPLARG